MQQSALAAAWFLPFVMPICLYVAFTDLRDMRITNQAVVALAAVFVLLGPFVLPFEAYLWALSHLGIMLVVGILLNAAGALGAGDAKFIAAAAPYVALGDLRVLMALFCAVLLAAFAAHQLAKRSPLRRIAPHWQSWDRGRKFPMGFALGPTLLAYLGLAATLGV